MRTVKKVNKQKTKIKKYQIWQYFISQNFAILVTFNQSWYLNGVTQLFSGPNENFINKGSIL